MTPIVLDPDARIDTRIGSLFTRAPAYNEQCRPKDMVSVHIRTEVLIIIPDGGKN
jgi:hypothetical protein